ncbi:hypothetical protein M0802_013789 [Mischocyttarus mexicanus]|nr:hypothetical protein M0802_013789 [Mischocyttarus mexicanus]
MVLDVVRRERKEREKGEEEKEEEEKEEEDDGRKTLLLYAMAWYAMVCYAVPACLPAAAACPDIELKIWITIDVKKKVRSRTSLIDDKWIDGLKVRG